MTLFEYLSVATSIVLSLSAAQLLTQLRSVLNPTKRYWVHTLWVFLALFGHLIIWWEFWGYRGDISWNFANFALLLLNPGILFVASNTLIHSETRGAKSWGEHFFEIRRPFFATFGMLPLVSVLRRWALTDVPLLSSNNLPEVGFALLLLIGFISGSRKVHAGLIITYWFALVITTANIWFLPGDVAN